MTVDEVIAQIKRAAEEWPAIKAVPGHEWRYVFFESTEPEPMLLLVAEIERLRRAEADMRERAAQLADDNSELGIGTATRALPLSGDVDA